MPVVPLATIQAARAGDRPASASSPPVMTRVPGAGSIRNAARSTCAVTSLSSVPRTGWPSREQTWRRAIPSSRSIVASTRSTPSMVSDSGLA